MRDEIRLSGINAQMNDYDASDGACAAMSGLWMEGQRLKGVRLPDAQFTLGEGLELMGVHETSQFRHLLLKEHYHGGWNLYWMDDDVTGEVTVEALAGHSVFISPSSYPIRKMAAIGNVIILLLEDGLRYLLWKADEENVPDATCAHRGGYKYLGAHLPELPIQFGLQGYNWIYPANAQDAQTSIRTNDDGSIKDADKAAVNAHVKGLLNKFIADASEDGAFVFPFLVRYAYRLYDGETLTMHSAPVLMTPSTKMAPILVRQLIDYDSSALLSLAAAGIRCYLDYYCYDSGAVAALEEWKDIVQSVDIFITPPIYTYDQSGEIDNLVGHDLLGDDSGYMVGMNFKNAAYTTISYGELVEHFGIYNAHNWWRVDIPLRNASTVDEEIRDASDFYLLKSLSIEDLSALPGQRNIIRMDGGYLRSLRQRERLEDDYCSHDRLIAETAFGYNNRMNFAGVSKRRFPGFDLRSALQWQEIGASAAQGWWHLDTIRGNKVVTPGEEGADDGDMKVPVMSYAGGYFFYPSADCGKVTLSGAGGYYYELPMKTHAMLNGSVYFAGLDAELPPATGTRPTSSADTLESMEDKLYTTEINNPFHIPLSGINTVPGGGKILGIASATKALSQGQFGQFPLYAFTDNGVWGLEVSSGAGYSAKQPIGRDVCVDGESITQTDDAVLFASGRGLMVVSGSKITCLSDKVRDALIPVEGIPDGTGLGFRDFMDGCRMMYDYAGQRLTVYHPDYDYALVYGIESGEWGGAVLGITGHVAAWPSPYVVCGREVRKLDGSEADGIVSGWLETRPMKLRSGGDVLKTVRSLIVRGMFRPRHVHVQLEGSRDLYNWCVVWSSDSHYVRGYSGSPWKYFRVKLWTVLEKDESLSGISLDYVAKYLGKMR